MDYSEHTYKKLPLPLDEDSATEETGRKVPAASSVPAELELSDILAAAAEGKRLSAEFYRRLSEMECSETARGILRQIMIDEVKHEKIFLRIRGEAFPISAADPGIISADLKKNYSDALFRLIEDVEFCRKIMFSFSDTKTRDMLYEIITDGQSHMVKIIYLLTL